MLCIRTSIRGFECRAPGGRFVTLWAKVLRNRLVLIGFVLLALNLGLAAFGPILNRASPTDIDISAMLVPPSFEHWFGTDTFGRDVYARVVYGVRMSLFVGLMVASVTTVAGVALGLMAGFSPVANVWIAPLLDAMMAFPTLLLALGLIAALGPSVTNIVLALGIVYTPRTARVVRAVTMSLREQPYVEAARAQGASTARILGLHILPNAAAPILVQATFILAYAILGEAGLGFVGVGIQPPTPTLGNILSEARTVIRQAPWLIIAPGSVLFSLILGVNLLGDGLRAVLDPMTRDPNIR